MKAYLNWVKANWGKCLVFMALALALFGFLLVKPIVYLLGINNSAVAKVKGAAGIATGV